MAVGSSHAMTERTAKLDLELVGELRRAVDVPLVLHGSSGVPDDELVRAVRAGLAKINIAHPAERRLHPLGAPEPGRPDPAGRSAQYLGPARDAVAAEVARLLRLLRPHSL